MTQELQFLEDVKNLAIEAAREAGELLINSFERIQVVEFKDRQDVCTNLDLEIEELLINKIQSKYPDHNIYSEERGEEDKKSKFTWIIDPIDGTKHYIRGLPMFCTSIALKKEEEIIFGLVFNPVTNEIFYALQNQGAFLNGNKTQVSQEKDIANSFIYAELPNYKLSEQEFNKYHKKLGTLFQHSYRVRAWGSGALGLCYVAMGGFEGYVILGNVTKIYDVAAGIIMIKEAGGKVTDLDGQLFAGKHINIVASNGKIHNQLLKLVK